jgi:hypothetical protein
MTDTLPVESQNKKGFRGKNKQIVPQYGLLFFDQLRGEYRSIKGAISQPSDVDILGEILSKRQDGTMTWDDIFTFDIVLLKYQDSETLRVKVCNLRNKYKAFVDSAEFEAYSTLKKVDLSLPAAEGDEELLRGEYYYLIKEFCTRYSLTAAKEKLRSRLLAAGAILTLVFFVLAGGVGIAIFSETSDVILTPLGTTLLGFSTLLTVIFAGVTGAFVSMQMRLQNTSGDGDPIQNLALLTHGWLSIFLSPLTGGIFAVILYLFFSGGVLTGTVFPKISTAKKSVELVVTAKYIPDPPKPTPTPTPTPALSSGEMTVEVPGPAAGTAVATPGVTPTVTPTVTPAPARAAKAREASPTPVPASTPSPSPSVSPLPKTQDGEATFRQEGTMQLTSFLRNTGPDSGIDFALLMIWCFIAGFAERFVPDTLMRMVNQKKDGGTADS